ncbi:sulfotransferase [Pseudooceanicola sp. HF7]|uniref:sulfotransferase n=1 Tax=Pseudooceanicola sp. HF7 TaxID=2721560 RepID=UPI0020CA41F8|nr:sulfotransferase [Pseudooceanicola sp. HF7]
MSDMAGKMLQTNAHAGLFGHLFLSTGAMKAGTTWLYSVLAQHPELHFTLEKEIHYFYHAYVNNRQLSDARRLTIAQDRYLPRYNPERTNPDRIRVNLHWVANYLSRPVDDLWYRNLFTRPRGELYNCDFSNLYAHLPPEAWQHIQGNCTRLKVIYTMRHPVKRLWSHVKFHLQVTDKLHLLDTWSPGKMQDFMRKPFIWENAEYGIILRRMRAALPEDGFRPFFYEDMRRDPRAFLAEIEDFLELPHHDYSEEIIERKVNESASIPMPDFFPELVSEDVARITAEVEAEGILVPESWSS